MSDTRPGWRLRRRQATAAVAQLGARARADGPILISLFLVVAIAAAVLAALPRALDRLADESLTSELERTIVSRRSVRVEAMAAVPEGGEAPLAVLRERGGRELAAAGPELRAALDGPRVVLDLPRYELGPLPGETPFPLLARLTVRVQEDIEDHLVVVSGHLPDGTTTRWRGDGASGDDEHEVHQIALSTETAETLDLDVGDRVLGTPDIEDAVARRTPTLRLGPAAFEVVGIVELTSADEDFWFSDDRLHRPARRETGAATTYFPFAVVPVGALDGVPRMDGGGTPALVEWRWGVDHRAIDASNVATLRSQIRRLEAETVSQPSGGQAALRTDLGALLDREAAQRSLAADTLALAGAALAGVALALVALTAGRTVARRSRATVLVRGRGGSAAQLVLAAAVEAVVLLVPAGWLGWWVSGLVVPGSRTPATATLAAALITATAVCLVVAAVVAEVRRPLAVAAREARTPRVPSRARRTFELVAVTVAIAGAASLRRRGVAVGEGVDPLLAATPVAVAFAGAVVASRVYRAPIGALRRQLARRRGLAAATGLARSSRDTALAPAVLTVVLGVAVTVFATAVGTTLESARSTTALDVAGAPVRIETELAGPVTDRLRALPDAPAAVATASRTAATITTNGRPQPIDLLVADPGELADVASQTALAFDPAPLQGPGDGRSRVPVIVVAGDGEASAPTVGDDLEVAVAGGRLAVEVVAVHPRVPGLGATGSLGLLAAPDAVAAVGVDGAPNEVLASGPAGSETAVRDAVAAADPAARTSTAASTAAELREQPLGRGVALGFRTVAWLSIAAAAVALATVLVASHRARSRDLALLLAIGADRGIRARVVLAELLPPALTAVLLGAVVGVGLTALVGGALDLSPFVGSTSPTTLRADLGVTATIVAAASVGVGLVVAVAAWRGRHRSSARTLREGNAP